MDSKLYNQIRYQKYKVSINKATQKYLAKNQAKRLYNSAKQHAKKLGVEFTITEEDIVIPTHCPYLKVVLTNISGQGRVATNASLERIDNSKGYIKENVQVISDLANRMKQNATKEQLLFFAQGILAIHKE